MLRIQSNCSSTPQSICVLPHNPTCRTARTQCTHTQSVFAVPHGHNAAMECYRRGMIGEQSFEGRRENLSQANKLSRTYAVLLDALNGHRGKGQQKVTVEHVHVHSGGQAIVGMVEQSGGVARMWRNNPMQLPIHRSRRCGAKTRSRSQCQSPAMPNGRCRLHGGKSPGAPRGNQNALKHGRYTSVAIATRRRIAALLRAVRKLAKETK
jgi:hypothetical protein